MRSHRLLLAAVVLALVSPAVVWATPWKKVKDDLDKAIQAGNNGEAVRLIKSIEDQSVEAVDYLLKRAIVADEEVYDAILGLCSGWTSPEIVKYYRKTIEAGRLSPKADYRERVFVVQIVEKSQIPEATDILCDALKDDSETVQRNGAEALGRRGDPKGVPSLIGLIEELEREKNTEVLYQAAREALTAITGEDFKTAKDWRDYWNVKGAGFDPKKDKGGKQTATVEREGDPEFFETEVISRRIVFIIDTSRTMLLVQKTDIPGLQPTDGSDALNPQGEPTEQITPENQKLAEYWMRINMVKRELSAVVRGMDERARFNIYRFDVKSAPWQSTMVKAAKPAKADAIKWVDTVKVSEQLGTNTEEVLATAFNQNPLANTFFFLSDGEPDKDGKKPGDPVEPILAMVKKLNRFRKAKVETFGFPGIEGTEFMKKLAADNGGKFHEILVKDK